MYANIGQWENGAAHGKTRPPIAVPASLTPDQLQALQAAGVDIDTDQNVFVDADSGQPFTEANRDELNQALTSAGQPPLPAPIATAPAPSAAAPTPAAAPTAAPTPARAPKAALTVLPVEVSSNWVGPAVVAGVVVAGAIALFWWRRR